MRLLALALLLLVRRLGGPCVEVAADHVYVGRHVAGHPTGGGLPTPHCHGLIYYRPFF